MVMIQDLERRTDNNSSPDLLVSLKREPREREVQSFHVRHFTIKRPSESSSSFSLQLFKVCGCGLDKGWINANS